MQQTKQRPGLRALLATAGVGLACLALQADTFTPGIVKRQYYPAYPLGSGYNNSFTQITNNALYPNAPLFTDYLPSIASTDFGTSSINSSYTLQNNYTEAISGYIIPASTGNYDFYYYSDDYGQLYLSTDNTPANLQLIAQESVWSNIGQYVTSGGSSSVPAKGSGTFTGTTWPTKNAAGGAAINLTGGQKYYFLAIFEEGGGGNHQGVTITPAGTPPNDSDPEIGNGTPLATIGVDAPTAPTFSAQPTNTSVLQNLAVTFVASGVGIPKNATEGLGTDNNPVVDPNYGGTVAQPYQWYKNGVPIDTTANPSAGTFILSIPQVSLADNGATFSVKFTDADGKTTVTSTNAVLTVIADKVPPTITVASGGDGKVSDFFTSATITFSKPMDTNSLLSATYTLSGGLTASSPSIISSTQVAIKTTKQTPGATYTLTITGAKDLAGNALTPNTATLGALVFKSGLATYNVWLNIKEGADDVDGFIANEFQNPPSSSTAVTAFQVPTSSPDVNNFGSETWGFFAPAVTGNYVFFISTDDGGELYLSTDNTPANKHLIAQETGWSNAGDWDKAESGDATAKRSDTFSGTTWPTGNTITLQAGQQYYLEIVHTEGGGGDQSEASVWLASRLTPDADGTHTDVDGQPMDGLASTLTGSLIGSYVNPLTLSPVITNAPVASHFHAGDTLTLSVGVDSLPAVSYQWYQNKLPIAGATNNPLVIKNASAANVGDYYVVVSNKNGTATSAEARQLMLGAFVVEAEDFNYTSTAPGGVATSGGLTLPAASIQPQVNIDPNGVGLYYGLNGAPGIDVFVSSSPGGTDDTSSGAEYRQGFVDTNGASVDFVTTAFDSNGNVGIEKNGDYDRGDYSVTVNYDIGWGAAGNWAQYTRDFPAGTYNAVGVGSTGGSESWGFDLSLVTGDATGTNVTLKTIGTFTQPNGFGTGGWNSNDLVPFTDGKGNLASFTLGKATTVRLTINAGDPNMDYILFYKTGGTTVAPTISVAADGTITYTGTLTSSSTVNGTYAPVAGATSPYKPKPSGNQFYRSSN